jgi:predicted NBD/HSP70 family sugar kinase
MRRIDFTNTQVASSETARDINRSVVLNLIRRSQPVSRADLARLSGLQRSTVSIIAEELISAGWVIDGQTGHLPRGRQPTLLRLNEKRALLVVDVRPSLTTVAVADINGRFLSQETLATPDHPKKMADVLAARLKRVVQLRTDLVFEGIGVSIPGRFDHHTQRVVFAPNLKWPDFDFKGTLERATGVRVELENAANACVLAEVWFNRMDRIRDLVVVTVSEGVGTGIFSNGQLARGLHGMAGEFGHVSLNPEGPQCMCGGRGCWEVYASNRAAVRYYRESSPSADSPTFQDLLSLAETGDAFAVRALERMARAIGSGMRMIVAGLAPEEIVVVGDITRQWHRFGAVIEAEVAAGVLVGKPPRIRPAEGLMARLRGTVALVLQKHFDPSARNVQPEKAITQRAV